MLRVGVVAQPGNLTVSLDLQGLPDRTAAEQVWSALGQPPVRRRHTPGQSACRPDEPAQRAWPRHVHHVHSRRRAALGGNRSRLPGSRGQAALTGTVAVAGAPISTTWDTTTTSPGLHTLGISVEDHVGNRASTEVPVAVAPPAYVEFVTPAEGASISNTVSVALAVTALAPVSEVVVTANGEEVYRFTGPPFETQWTTWRNPPGDTILEAGLTTSDGYISNAQRTIAVAPHISVGLTEPQPGQILKGPVTLTADVRSDAPTSEVVFYVDDQEVGRITASPYQIQLHTGDYPPGDYRFRAEATNQAGMTASADVQASMTPTTRTGALGAALICGLALLLIIPMVFVARRRRTDARLPQAQQPD